MVKDGFKEPGSLNKVLEKAGKIVTYVRKSINGSDLLEGEKKLQAKVATRWNSELHSIKSILSIPEDKLLQLDTVHLTTYERNILQDLVEILTPFHIRRKRSYSQLCSAMYSGT